MAALKPGIRITFTRIKCHCPVGAKRCTCTRTTETKTKMVSYTAKVRLDWDGLYVDGEVLATLRNDYGDIYLYVYGNQEWEAVEISLG